jgi:hypothetical protein
MMEIVNGELRIKVEDANEISAGLIPVVMKRFERVVEENALLLYEIKKLKETPKTPFSFCLN